MVLTLPHKPAGDQWNYFNLSTATVGVIGRQYGKSTLAQLRAVRKDLSKASKANRYWVSPIVLRRGCSLRGSAGITQAS